MHPPHTHTPTQVLVHEFSDWASVQADRSFQFDWDDALGNNARRDAGLRLEKLRQVCGGGGGGGACVHANAGGGTHARNPLPHASPPPARPPQAEIKRLRAETRSKNVGVSDAEKRSAAKAVRMPGRDASSFDPK